jgi:hypothetical protein
MSINKYFQVNLDAITRSATMSSLENPSRVTFKLAQRKIQALMEKDSYPRPTEQRYYKERYNLEHYT